MKKNIVTKIKLAFKGFAWGLLSDEVELRQLMDHAHHRGLVESDEHEMIHNVFELRLCVKVSLLPFALVTHAFLLSVKESITSLASLT
jgi:CBS domain containing-hemolysin-like protein